MTMRHNVQMPKPARPNREPKLHTDKCGRPKYATRLEAQLAMMPDIRPDEVYCCEDGWYHIQIRMD